MSFSVLLTACSLGLSANSKHSCLGTSIFSSGMLTPQRDVLFLVLVTACSFCSSSNHSHFGGVIRSYRRSALSSWYKYLLFRNAFNTAGCALLGSYVGLLAWLLLQSRSTLVLVQVSSLQEYLHHSGMCSSWFS
jgi:hypothetical protein